MSSCLTYLRWSFQFALLSSRAIVVYRTHCSPMRLHLTYFTFSSLAFLVYRTCCSTLIPKSIFPMIVHNSRSGNFTCSCSSDILFDIGRYYSLISLSPVYLCIFQIVTLGPFGDFQVCTHLYITNPRYKSFTVGLIIYMQY